MAHVDSIFLKQLFTGEEIYLIPEKKQEEDTVSGLISNPVVAVIEPAKQEVIAEEKPVESIQEKPPVVEIAVNIPQISQKVLILVESIEKEEAEFLAKVLGAVGLSLEKVDLIDLSKTGQTDLKNVLSQKFVNQFVTFGVSLFKINLEIPLTPYEIRSIQGINFLFAHSLTEISSNQNLKKQLWASLKSLFAIA
ncbi:hypothetical protein SAMN04515674_10793 [Pseudarcicella hirudinis]|uniref:DNA polymerase III psi subunit n=1 Tax=Pseudarcicella hirudinis TaxID=1079859 RepID=A0A1I5UBD8_9BACT|nr:hypothetical protein [Pseudarcicella hirudinis]SFP92611.1 hypothetical protein SAMN04515674_10793 [Pseudarcicella hirudinis]